MNFKEFLIDVLAVALGMILAKIIQSRLPSALGGSWEESYEEVKS